MPRKITIGTRGSKLAIIQAEQVSTILKETAPGLEVNLVKIKTTGDQENDIALDKFSQEGIFVKELEKALLDSKIDLAVHSLKDLPTDIPVGLSLAGVIARLDPRDALISTLGGIDKLPKGAKIGTGSPRRAIQLLTWRHDLQICQLRGNIDTRLRKVDEGTFHGIIMAAAALIRLGIPDKITEYLPVERFTPAVGQGALGLEIRSEDAEMIAIVSKINHEPTWKCITAERTFLKALGGGCRAPIAALGTVLSDNRLKLEGMVAGIQSKQIIRSVEEGPPEASDEVGLKLMQKMMKIGASKHIAEAS